MDALDLRNLKEWQNKQQDKPLTTFSSLWSKRHLRRNLIAAVLLNSCCAFCNYLVGYYTKYFPGNFFFNYGVIGVADAFTIIYVHSLSKCMKKLIHILNFGLACVIAWSILFIGLQDIYPQVVPIGILALRLNLAAL